MSEPQTDLSEDLKARARKVARHVKDGAAEAADEAQEHARTFVQEQKKSIVDQLEALGDAIQESASCLRDRQVNSIASLAEQAADSVSQLSRTIRKQDYEDMLETAQDWARRHPRLFLGGCFLGGILAARFFRSSRRSLAGTSRRSEEHTSELQSLRHLVCRLLLEKKKHN